MNCKYCGEELKEGSLYCSKCGKPVQIVPDYNVYDEDEYLKRILQEEQTTKMNAPKETSKKELSSKQIKMIVACILAAIFVIIIIAASFIHVKAERANSFEYQMEMAEKAYNEGNFDAAIGYYMRATVIEKDNVSAYLPLAAIYMEQQNYMMAESLYQSIIQIDPKNEEACRQLIGIYENQKDYDSVLELSKQVDASLQDLFASYTVPVPFVSVDPGTYDSFQSIGLTAPENCTIFYSLNGADPTLQGERYTMPIELNENMKEYNILAVCVNEKGIYSEVAKYTYKIDIPAPSMPIVTPDGGDFGVETQVTVTVPSGCNAYYTWDSTEPNAYSTRYSGPITVPQGNNVLSVVIIDQATGLQSDTYRGNFVYYEEEGEAIGTDSETVEE